jgi:hypothetical protein
MALRAADGHESHESDAAGNRSLAIAALKRPVTLVRIAGSRAL